MVDVYGDCEEFFGKWFFFYFECCEDIFFVFKFVFGGWINEKGEFKFVIDFIFEYV